MSYRYNPPPGWPVPPEGWTPPPGWEPDASWGAAPEGWQFWLDEAGNPPQAQPHDATEVIASPGAPAAPAAPAAPEHANMTQELYTGGQPTTAFPAANAGYGQAAPQSAPQPSMGAYQYAPSVGLDSPGASPYDSGSSSAGGFGGPGGPGGYPGGPGGPGAPTKKNTGAIIGAVVAALAIIGLLIFIAIKLFGGGGGDDPNADPTTPVPTTATSQEPSEEPTEEETTDEPTDEPTDDATTAGTASDEDYIDLTGSDPVIVGSAANPEAEVRLLQVEEGWAPDSSNFMCSESTHGQYIALELEFTIPEGQTTPYSFIGWELGAQDADGVPLEVNNMAGLFCSTESPPTEMQPGTYTGWAIIDAPAETAAITWTPFLDIGGTADSYRWVLADQ